MQTSIPKTGIRPNPAGDWPKIDPTAFVDSSAQIMGNVIIGRNVYVGPMSVIRADEIGPDGKVHPVIIEDGTCVQDGVIIHGRSGTVVQIGKDANISHGVVIHGPTIAFWPSGRLFTTRFSKNRCGSESQPTSCAQRSPPTPGYPQGPSFDQTRTRVPFG
jgi:hypothetical protein